MKNKSKKQIIMGIKFEDIPTFHRDDSTHTEHLESINGNDMVEFPQCNLEHKSC